MNSKLKENASNGAEPKDEKLRSRKKCGVSIGRGHDLGWPGGQPLPSLCQPPVPLWLAALLILFLSLNQTPDFAKVETKVWSGSCPLLTSGVLATVRGVGSLSTALQISSCPRPKPALSLLSQHWSPSHGNLFLQIAAVLQKPPVSPCCPQGHRYVHQFPVAQQRGPQNRRSWSGAQ